VRVRGGRGREEEEDGARDSEKGVKDKEGSIEPNQWSGSPFFNLENRLKTFQSVCEQLPY
jgi:hypothetical protein